MKPVVYWLLWNDLENGWQKTFAVNLVPLKIFLLHYDRFVHPLLMCSVAALSLWVRPTLSSPAAARWCTGRRRCLPGSEMSVPGCGGWTSARWSGWWKWAGCSGCWCEWPGCVSPCSPAPVSSPEWQPAAGSAGASPAAAGWVAVLSEGAAGDCDGPVGARSPLCSEWWRASAQAGAPSGPPAYW